MRCLIKMILTILILLSIAAVNCYASDKLYTAYNIWKWGGYNNAFINFKGGRSMIPAGTEIKARPLIFENQPYNNNQLHPQHVLYKTLPDNKNHRIHFVLRHHRKKTIKDYMGYTFTPKNFEELTVGMTEAEIDAIKKGVIVDGMGKEAVLICYGYPIERHTRSLDSNVWIYYMNARTQKRIQFNSKGRTGPEIATMETKSQQTVMETDLETENQGANTDFEKKFMLLQKLLDKNLITQEEYDKKKAVLLEDL